MQTATNSIPAPDSAFDIQSRGVLIPMSGRTGHTLTESTHADCEDCEALVGLAHLIGDRTGSSVVTKTDDGHTGRVTAYDPGPNA
jgi:hypothetical protein